MFTLRNINPMVRAVGTMGAVVALVGGVTFANLTSNTVALSPNTLSSSTAALVIGAGTACPGTNLTKVPGFTDVKLTPGVTSAALPFCLDNTSDIPLRVAAQIPSALTGNLPAGDVTLAITCPTIGSVSNTLDHFITTPQLFPVMEPTAIPDDCSATVTLAASYTGSGGQSTAPFDINFVGNQ